MAEELIGGFASPNIARGKLRGYGLYVTTDRIIGVKGGLKQFTGVLGEIMIGAGAGLLGGAGFIVAGTTGIAAGSALKDVSTDDARKTLEQVEQKKDFEIHKAELE